VLSAAVEVEVGAGDAEDRYARFARNRARKQLFAGTRRSHEQDALRNPRPDGGELPRVLQELDGRWQVARYSYGLAAFAKKLRTLHGAAALVI